MPLFDFQCDACKAGFERLVRNGEMPTCPQCGSPTLTRLLVSRLAPAGKIEAIRQSNRRAAHAQGLFNNYSTTDQARLLKGKPV
ncbi:FmdB family zinc ribbon protein [Roseateles saccharophilus]|uniref:Putative FmdB family regulatory protein n=1 Tax=Roseateles saccharophilus TaxID=304 RepID=A0A4R3VI63_ROSSA|nr:zinc ribbon domain-containing protein [Roseateles saccharophilus]MDG0832066.1 zinc ribbon domain-containing protein [Roseateles saccharophilus]TCV03474.1 putative FmdB family regulatory protein [Roseateles saccharophilus]